MYKMIDIYKSVRSFFLWEFSEKFIRIIRGINKFSFMFLFPFFENFNLNFLHDL